MGRVVSWQFCGSEPRRHVTNTLCCACDSLRVRVNNQCRYEPLCALLEFISRRTSAGTCHRRCAPPPCRGNLVTGHPGNDRRDFLAPAAGGHMAKVQCWRVLCRNHRHCCKWKAHPVTQAVVVVGWSRVRDVCGCGCGGGARGAWQTGGLVDGGAGLATPPQLRREQRCARLGVAFGAIECP